MGRTTREFFFFVLMETAEDSCSDPLPDGNWPDGLSSLRWRSSFRRSSLGRGAGTGSLKKSVLWAALRRARKYSWDSLIVRAALIEGSWVIIEEELFLEMNGKQTYVATKRAIAIA